MNNYDKRLWVEMAITFTMAMIILGAVYLAKRYHEDFRSDCMNAGGMPVDMLCINPSAVIEVGK